MVNSILKTPLPESTTLWGMCRFSGPEQNIFGQFSFLSPSLYKREVLQAFNNPDRKIQSDVKLQRDQKNMLRSDRLVGQLLIWPI